MEKDSLQSSQGRFEYFVKMQKPTRDELKKILGFLAINTPAVLLALYWAKSSSPKLVKYPAACISSCGYRIFIKAILHIIFRKKIKPLSLSDLGEALSIPALTLVIREAISICFPNP